MNQQIRRIYITHVILCVDLYARVGEEEAYDGNVVFLRRIVQRCPAILQGTKETRDEWS